MKRFRLKRFKLPPPLGGMTAQYGVIQLFRNEYISPKPIWVAKYDPATIARAKARESRRIKTARKRGEGKKREKKDGGPGGIRTHGVLSEADYESAACNQHGVRPCQSRKKETRCLGRASGGILPESGRKPTRRITGFATNQLPSRKLFS